MSAGKSADINIEHASVQLDTLGLEPDGIIGRADTAVDHKMLLLGIEVYHLIGRKERYIKAERAHKPRLLAYGKQTFERRVHERVIVKKCKHRRNGKAVVTAERCTLSREKTVLLDQAQRL